MRAVTLIAAILVMTTVTAAPMERPELVRAIERGDRDAAVALLNSGANVRDKDPDGTTALHWAAHLGDADLTRKLIRAGADVRAVNDYGSTPLSSAAEI